MRASTSALLSRRRLHNPCGTGSCGRKRNQSTHKHSALEPLPKSTRRDNPSVRAANPRRATVRSITALNTTTQSSAPAAVVAANAPGLPHVSGWYPAVTHPQLAVMLPSYVVVSGAGTGVLYKAGFPPRQVTITDQKPGGPTGTRVQVSAGGITSPTTYPPGWPTVQLGQPAEALAPFSQGGSVMAPRGGARVGNPAMRSAGGGIGGGGGFRNPAVRGAADQDLALAASTTQRGGGCDSGWCDITTKPPDNAPTPTIVLLGTGADAARLDVAALKLRSKNPALDGVAVLDVEPMNASDELAEGDVVVASFIDPADGREKMAVVLVGEEDGEPWWKHDGHCCEDCALGKGSSCDGDSCSVDSGRKSNPGRRYGVFDR